MKGAALEDQGNDHQHLCSGDLPPPPDQRKWILFSPISGRAFPERFSWGPPGVSKVEPLTLPPVSPLRCPLLSFRGAFGGGCSSSGREDDSAGCGVVSFLAGSFLFFARCCPASSSVYSGALSGLCCELEAATKQSTEEKRQRASSVKRRCIGAPSLKFAGLSFPQKV